MRVSFKINGRACSFEIDNDEFLIKTLRDNGYLGVKQGCDTGSCGLCTVWMDEKPVLSCTLLSAKADGHEITTIEGVQSEAAELGKFLVSEGVDQCGFCSPGFVMTVLAMRRELDKPSEDEVRHYMSGNLCRCSGYVGQTRALMKYLEVCG